MIQTANQTSQVIVGVFESYRDGHEALRALQEAGLSRDDAHLYRAGQHDATLDAFPMLSHEEDEAEYVAHGEHQGVIGAHNRFATRELATPRPPAPASSDDCCRERTLLVIKMTDEIKPGALGDMLHEHGAIAVKDPAGHWRFSPYRNHARA
ncbi:hypothetical protein P9239_01940 [Caballeronia sp. LZ062]|uniref:hypothetical protein n=1 Tax=unclassified Caballeronia TaxID=2646786 RepID=UPI00285E79D4|nr:MULTISPECIES: hypothetical protein [unclassified Caballeronia]MDR5857571.1 hypothetical protein [Caballeronia sp. LZ050]MDR5869121.1 hypothetical protein [Caballeronia sp. LZ062]